LEEEVSEHFGSASYFTIVNTETDQTEIIDIQNQHHTHGQCQPMIGLAGKGIDGVVCIGMGRGAVEKLNSDGIKVFLRTGDKAKTVVEQYKNGSLKEMAAGHGCH
jgi:predicted Fe-Mo cluster-binding NifX family protein